MFQNHEIRQGAAKAGHWMTMMATTGQLQKTGCRHAGIHQLKGIIFP